MPTSVTLLVGDSQLEIIPQEGAVLAKFQNHGEQFLAETPWAAAVVTSATPAPDEPSWVKNWRGGWQLCAPNTGSPGERDQDSAFHGAASQANWIVSGVTNDSVSLSWMDDRGEIELARRWNIGETGVVSTTTSATNHSGVQKVLGLAEHLILGSDFLQPVKQGSVVSLNFCSTATIIELDISGAPLEVGAKRSASTSDFTRLSVQQPAKVFALAHPQKKTISIEVGEWVARVEWEGLDHALIWQEFGTSAESPWNNQVFALGIEPTNVAHGLGANDVDGPFLSPGQTITWKTSLQFFRKVDDSLEERD